MWNESFECVLRRHLPFLPADSAVPVDTDLRDLGLDSLGSVDLLADLESTFGTRFPDDALDLETFAGAGRLWEAVRRMTATPSV